MPFPKLKSMPSHLGGAIYLPELVTTTKHVDGVDVDESHIELVNQSKPLPDMKDFYLGNQLKAGVPLKQVSGIMIPASTLPLEVPSEDKSSDVTDKKDSQTNTTTKE